LTTVNIQPPLTPIPSPMLATSGKPSGSLAAWTAEFKADRFRCQIAVVGGRRVVRTRGGHDVADRVPELKPLSQLGVDFVLDGELIAGAGRPQDFYEVIGAVSARQRDRAVLNFLAFDLLWLDGSGVVEFPHADRRRLLERLAELSNGTVNVVRSFDAVDIDDLVAGCEDLDLEGVVLKRSASRYRPGRSRDWRTMCSYTGGCRPRHRRVGTRTSPMPSASGCRR
jgi:bifunctional non-homologous end joining protein LigD